MKIMSALASVVALSSVSCKPADPNAGVNAANGGQKSGRWALLANRFETLDVARQELQSVPTWAKNGFPDWSNEARIARCDNSFLVYFVFPNKESALSAKEAYYQKLEKKYKQNPNAEANNSFVPYVMYGPLETTIDAVDYEKWCPTKVEYNYRAK
jgi:hypothetical protein